ncbi:MAG TPA: alpha/beta fold hydrolase [Kofleriaceae bacterium]|nr:alpha/beta fold hydrolase [Kofleriaceae bacterium]
MRTPVARAARRVASSLVAFATRSIAFVFLIAGCDGMDEAPAAEGPAPPAQPATGPGGAEYPHGGARVRTYGSGEEQYWLYEPAMPAPDAAPVLVYLHGYSSREPALYDALLTHLARKGHIVIYPVYGGLLDPQNYQPNARAAIAAALAELDSPEHVHSDGHFGLLGHSLGTMIALRLAAKPQATPELPVPEILVLHEPAGKTAPFIEGNPDWDVSEQTLIEIAPTTRLLLIQAETSATDPNSVAPDAWHNTPQLARAQKNFLRVISDEHGRPALVSDHTGVQAGQNVTHFDPLDGIDWWGYWRPTDGALSEVFGRGELPAGYSAFCSSAGPRCDPVRHMGQWSDGVAVTPMQNAAELGL